MTIYGLGMRHGYEVLNKTLNMPQDKMEQAKKLTEEVVGGALNKQIKHQQNMLKVNAQMQIGLNNMIQQQSMISLFV